MTKEEKDTLEICIQMLAYANSFKIYARMGGEDNSYIKTWNSVYMEDDSFELVTEVDNKQITERLSYMTVWQEIKKYGGAVTPKTTMNVIIDKITENANIIKSKE